MNGPRIRSAAVWLVPFILESRIARYDRRFYTINDYCEDSRQRGANQRSGRREIDIMQPDDFLFLFFLIIRADATPTGKLVVAQDDGAHGRHGP